jgi:hypothetical protein
MTESKRGQSLFRKGAIHHIGGWKGARTRRDIGTDREPRTFCVHGQRGAARSRSGLNPDYEATLGLYCLLLGTYEEEGDGVGKDC